MSEFEDKKSKNIQKEHLGRFVIENNANPG